MIDWTQVQTLLRDIGPDSFREVVALFLEEVDATTARLRDCGPSDDLAADLHFLKGSALNLGFAELAALCAHGEHLASTGSAADVDLPEILFSYARSRTNFESDLAARTGL